MKRLLGRHPAVAALLVLMTVGTTACADKGAPSAGASDTPSVILSEIAEPTTSADDCAAGPAGAGPSVGRGSAGLLEAMPEPAARFLDGLSG